jgi:hypothetical protein
MHNTGLTGPVQLIGRDNLCDEDRLLLEIEYAMVCNFAYRMRLDLALLFNTVFIAAGLKKAYTPETLRILISRYTYGQIENLTAHGERRSFLRYAVTLPGRLQLDDDRSVSVSLRNIGYKGASIDLPTQAAQAEEILNCRRIRLEFPAFFGDPTVSLKCRIIECLATDTDTSITRLDFEPDIGHGDRIAAIIASKLGSVKQNKAKP